MDTREGPKGLTRRQLLSRATAAGASFVIGSGFMAARDAAWATELTALTSTTFATLAQMARDIYPHNRIGDQFYVLAVKAHDTAEAAPAIEAGIAALDAAARGRGFANYLETGWERDRVDILRDIEKGDFFQMIRSNLVTGLYNQKAVWPVFGYEGESYSKGGYIHRGFDDIDWL